MTSEQWMLIAEALTKATKRARIAEDKLEAIRKWGTKAELYSMGHGLRTHFDELWKILGAEE